MTLVLRKLRYNAGGTGFFSVDNIFLNTAFLFAADRIISE